jgi:hypothetical protein
VSQPPKSTPHSDLDGVHRDERPNVETAVETGQDAGTVAREQEESVGRPDYSDEGSADDRSR